MLRLLALGSVLALAACQSPTPAATATTTNHDAAAQFLLGKSAGEAMRYFGHPTQGMPPSTIGAVLAWQNTYVVTSTAGKLLPAYPPPSASPDPVPEPPHLAHYDPNTIVLERCRVLVETDADFITTRVQVQDCTAF